MIENKILLLHLRKETMQKLREAFILQATSWTTLGYLIFNL